MSAYPTRYVPAHPRASASGCVYEHVLVAERALGRYLPDGVEVHHVDEDVKNAARTNLVICQDREYHDLLHVRMRVIRAGGNPNTQRVCHACRIAKGFAAFNRSKSNKNGGVTGRCRDCSKSAFKKWRLGKT